MLNPAPRAMILAAGRGERLRPITDHQPKPLVKVAGETLIGRLLGQLRQSGICEVVINLSYRGEQIRQALGDGHDYGVSIQWSQEPEQALETAGGIVHALGFLGEAPFVLVNGDLWTDFQFSGLTLDQDRDAHLIMVDNPAHNPQGDFQIDADGLVRRQGPSRLTFSGISMLRPHLFAGLEPGRRALAPVLIEAMGRQRVSGEHFTGLWNDIGTPQRLADLERKLGAT